MKMDNYEQRFQDVSMLALDQLYFANPSEFNDPFDCRAQRNQARNLREEIANFIRRDGFQRGLSELEIEAILERIGQYRDIVSSSKEADAEEAALRRHISEEIGIVSLTSCNNSILMWSHYADFHRGFCMGFNTVNFGFPDNSINEVRKKRVSSIMCATGTQTILKGIRMLL